MTAVLDQVLIATDFWECFDAFTPRPYVRTLDWMIEHCVNNEGKPYDHKAYPYIGAPGGPCDAWDDFRTRTVALQWGSRLGKTFFGQCATLKNADCNPAPQIFGSSTEKLAKEVVQRTYAMIRQRAYLSDKMLKKERAQKQTLIEFKDSKVFVGWSRSSSTFADKNCKYGHANELDDWEHLSTCKDGDPEDQFCDRFKDNQSIRKVLFDSIPKIRGKSRIERRLKAGTNCRLWVPCPRKACRRYQILEFGGKDSPHGIKWTSTGSRKTDAAKAKETAHYICKHCAGRIEEHERAPMIRLGVWCPAGCEVIDKEALAIAEGRKPYKWEGWKSACWIKGKPINDGEDASYQLSSIYALSLTFGDVAKQFLNVKDKPQKLRNFINQWLGETWEPGQARSTAEMVAARLKTDLPRGIVPLEGRFMVVAVDRQRAEGGFVVWQAMAHGAEERAWTVDYGVAPTLASIWDSVIRREYQHADGGPRLVPVAAVIDSGWATKETYDFCAAHPGCWPCKGSSTDMGTLAYRIGIPSKGTVAAAQGQTLIEVNTDYWETELQARIDQRLAGEPGSLSLCEDAARDEEFLEQLLNATLADKIDNRGEAKLLWVKKDENIPNDMRDNTRYGLCLGKAWLDDRGGVLPPRIQEARPIRSGVNAGFSRPDGRSWL